MRKLIFILIALISFSQAQTIQYIGGPTTTVISRGNFRADSIFYLPKRTKTPTDTAAFRYQISDSSLYYWTGYQWTKVQSASSFASVDTNIISTRLWRQKGIDSVQYNVGLKVNISDTASMLSPYIVGSGTSNYFPKFNATRSVVNSKLYESNLNLLFNSTTPYFTTSGISSIENNGTSASVYLLKTLDTARAYISFGGANTMDINNLRAGDIRFYTNATLRGRFQTDGTFRLNSLTGTGSRIVVADDNGVLSATSSATGLVDTTLLSTRAYRQKGDDSLGAIIATKGSGTVTSVATGYGLSGGTITTTGTLIADTALVASRLRLGKVADSLSLVKQNVLTNPVTGTGTTNYVPKFTGTSTIGNSQIFDNGTSVGIGNVSPLAPLHVGNRLVNNSVDPVILISRNVNDSSGSGNAHAFTDGSNVYRSGGMSYNSFDARINITGSNNMGHYAAFQAAPEYSNSGTMDEYFGFFSYIGTNSGTITHNYNNYVANPTGAGSVTNNYGLYVAPQTKGTNNYAVHLNNADATGRYNLYVNGTAYNFLNGRTGIGTSSPATMLDVVGTGQFSGELRLNSTGSQIRFGGQGTGVQTGIFQGTNSSNLYIADYATATKGIRIDAGSGEVYINANATDAGAYTLQNNGALYNTGSAILAATSGNVGIGLTSPPSKLSIATGDFSSQQAANADVPLFLRMAAGSSTSTRNTFVSQIYTASNTDQSNHQLLFVNGNNVAFRSGSIVYTNDGAIAIRTAGSNVAANTLTGTEYFRVTSDGESLFGTTTDAGNYRVQVSGNAYVTGDAIFAVGASSNNVRIGSANASSAKLFVSKSGLNTIFDSGIASDARLEFHYNGNRNSLLNFDSGITGFQQENNITFYFSGGNGLSIGSSSINSTAILDVQSTTKGFLPPRMTTTQRDAISSPAAGLVIYNTTTSKLQVYTTSWTDLH